LLGTAGGGFHAPCQPWLRLVDTGRVHTVFTAQGHRHERGGNCGLNNDQNAQPGGCEKSFAHMFCALDLNVSTPVCHPQMERDRRSAVVHRSAGEAAALSPLPCGFDECLAGRLLSIRNIRNRLVLRLISYLGNLWPAEWMAARLGRTVKHAAVRLFLVKRVS